VPKRLLFLALAIIAGAGVAWAYATTAGFGFRYDDYGVVRPWTGSEVLRVLDHSWDPTGIEPSFYRPLAAWWYALRFSIFGINAKAQHLVSLTGMALCSLLAGLFVWRETNRAYGAAVATLLYAIYPAFVYSQAIWLTNQMHLFAASSCWSRFWCGSGRAGVAARRGGGCWSCR